MLKLAVLLMLSGNFWPVSPTGSTDIARSRALGSGAFLQVALRKYHAENGVADPCRSIGFAYLIPFRSERWPKISSPFGLRFHPVLKYTRFHEGWDLPKPHGTAVYPSRNGRVVFAGWRSGYGKILEIRHADGVITRYGHLSEIHVRVGQWVRQGKNLIGRVGSTGLSTGPHLHFEVRDARGVPLDPYQKMGRVRGRFVGGI
ncbi:MAG: M23 family metallopeptidase [Elusimicrobia bacterium]|nr:M23 family metallopeptidase [Elusimicrobiota bacterium]